MDSSTDSEDEAEEIAREKRDRVDTSGTRPGYKMSPFGKQSVASSEAKDNFDKSISGQDLGASYDKLRTMTDHKQRKKIFSKKPEIIDMEELQGHSSSALSVREQIDTL